MKLNVDLLEGFDYSPGVRELPVVLSVVVDEVVEAAKKVSVDGVMLELEGNEDVYFSYSKRDLGYSNEPFRFEPEHPYRVIVDLMEEWREYDEDDELAHLRQVVAGDYKLNASVSVYLGKADGTFELVVLGAQRDVHIPEVF